MRITVRRTGGFAGIARMFEIDTALLSPARAAKIERLAKVAREAPHRARRPPPADAFLYEVTVDGKTTIVDDAEALIEELGR